VISAALWGLALELNQLTASTGVEWPLHNVSAFLQSPERRVLEPHGNDVLDFSLRNGVKEALMSLARGIYFPVMTWGHFHCGSDSRIVTEMLYRMACDSQPHLEVICRGRAKVFILDHYLLIVISEVLNPSRSYPHICSKLIFCRPLRKAHLFMSGIGISLSYFQRPFSIMSGGDRSIGGLSRIVKADQQADNAQPAKPQLQPSPIRSIARSFRSAPLGAQIGIAFAPGFPAWLVIFRGLDRFEGYGGRGRSVWQGVLHLCTGLALFGLSGFLWSLISPS